MPPVAIEKSSENQSDEEMDGQEQDKQSDEVS
jgi:hypothetical protein